MRRWLIGSATNHRDFQRIDFHNYVNKEISFVRSNDILMYARGKHTQLNNDRRVHPGIWTRQHDQCLNDDSIISRLRMKLQTNTSRQQGCQKFRIYTSQTICRYSGQKQHGDQEMNAKGERYYYIKNSQEVVKLPRHS